MISAGNDIVSFAETNPVRTTQPAFFKKFLTDSEIALFEGLPAGVFPFAQYVWLLWSAKEAAFKYLHRLDPQLIFSPAKFVVSPINQFQKQDSLADTDERVQKVEWICCGQLNFYNQKLNFESSITAEYVHTVIVDTNGAGKLYHGVKKIEDPSPEMQSEEVRSYCLEKISLVKFAAGFQIRKTDGGVPLLYDKHTNATYPVSFSHHGHFVAFSFLM